ncbi:DEAD/DEAH box helicase [Rhodococcus sp. WAY2]|uniref:DEAD/DEAH box helicase n=1 Tax=Rhodococcus sp. WAY2 TaxID=2663121 RepID=UPI001358874E|nr:DEAD/DEAH box helicase [Rhodococcus sp. WAY2]
MAALGELLAGCDREPGRRRLEFERICQWYLTRDPVYACALRRVWLWSQWPGRWGDDAGIGLVAEDRRGQLWAIGVKACSDAAWVTHRDVANFLAASDRAEFSFRLFIAPTNLIGRAARHSIATERRPAGLVLLDDLDAAVQWPADPADLRARRPAPTRPRRHHRDAVEAVVQGFARADRGQLMMAHGTGKTLTALLIRDTLAVERTLVLVPTLSLLARTVRTWAADTTVGFDVLAVCADGTVAEPESGVANTSDLGLPVTTDPGQIAAFLRRRSGPRVVFATYRSAPVIARAFRLGKVPAFDLAIADDAEDRAGHGGGATLFDTGAITARRRLFLTAPGARVRRGTQETQEADAPAYAAGDREVFGPVFHRLGVAEAVERGLLTDYRVVVIVVDGGADRHRPRNPSVAADGTEATDSRVLAGIGVAQAMHRYHLHRTLTVHSAVDRAQQFARWFPEVIATMPAHARPTGRVWSDYASGEMPARKLHMLGQHLGGLGNRGRGLLATARPLGVDVPAVDSVAFIDPCRSAADTAVAVGHAVRPAPGKTIGTIVLPVFLDAGTDPTTALEDSSFEPVWDVLTVLRSIDDRLADQLDELRPLRGHERRQPRLPPQIRLHLPATIGRTFARAFTAYLLERTADAAPLGGWVEGQGPPDGNDAPGRRTRLAALSGSTAQDPVADPWEAGYRHLLNYAAHHGDACIPVSYTVDGYRLGAWVNRQRTQYTRGALGADRARRLEAVPGWTWDARADQWQNGYRELLEYVDHQGHDRVLPYGSRLGSWVSQQRRHYARGMLRDDRARRLEAVPGWTWDPGADRWEEAFGRLAEYADHHGHARVPQSYTVDGCQLGHWVHKQRRTFAHGAMDLGRARRLEAVPGWAWDSAGGRWEELWEEGFRRLETYVETIGDARVPYACTTGSYRLGVWVSIQRRHHAEGHLDSPRARRLEAVPGWVWDPFADQWEQGFRRLVDYAAHFGDTRVPRSYTVEDYRLGAWVTKQRTRRKAGALGADRARRLQALPGWTWAGH